tara:strand:- start:405 stop:2825 length:2421 start_codon:yes stop_codon:yes gene_type:complete
MKNKTKQRKRYTPKRADYRNGGRVGYQEAGMVNEREMFNRANEEAMRQAQQASSPTTSTSPATAQQPIEQAPVITPEKTEQAVVAPPQTTEPEITTTPTGGGNFLQKIRRGVQQQAENVAAVGQSDLSKRIEGGEKIDAMTFYWVKPDGSIGSTDKGYSRVPSEFKNQLYLTQGEANKKSSDIINNKGRRRDVETGLPEMPTDKEIFEEERGKRIIETGQTAAKIASGEIPEGMIPKQELVKVAKGEEYIDTAVQMGDLTPIEAEKIKNVTPEQVAQMEATQAERPEVIEAAKMQAAKITESPEVQAAEGEVRQESLAKAAKVDRVAPIEGADVEIPVGALTERVVGTISEGAKASAAINVGTSLARITRAKKQLTKAGLTDEQINDIGNDPALLEDKLADFSEEERGLIEGLPEEALVSTQLNGLLEGIENGQIPPWAAPAVSQVEQMLAARGLSASSVGRDNLFNSIIQSAMPIAQSNAQAIQASVSQQKNIEAAANEANAQRAQQTATQNAQNVFNMDMAQFNSDQQIALSNSKFLQTVGLTEANNDQQAAVQNALLMSQANLAEADFYQKAQIQNAQAFLQTDMANLNNQQQVNVLKAQQEQQRLLSNQSAENAARQFNSASENQTQQFMASLNAQVNQFNTQQANAAAQFNTQQTNAAEARRVGIEADINKANAAIVNQTKQFNAQLDFQRDQWNAANQQAVQQSNVNWRRKANLADTAAANAINQQNVQNAFGMTSAAQSFLWQELRDQASFDFQFADNTATRKNNAMIAAASSEGDAAKNWSSNYNNVSSVVDKIFGTG